MGEHQRAETSGLISFLLCSMVGVVAMELYLRLAPAIWLVTQRMFIVASGIVAICGVISFSIGYANKSRSWTLRRGWLVPIRRAFEVLALCVVYAATLFLTSFMLLSLINNTLGRAFLSYTPGVCAVLAGVGGYVTLVQAELMNAKTLASLLPFFLISGVAIAGLTSDDPYWYNNNFSQLGDRTTFAARLFNSTLILAGVCMIIVSYFAVSELITTNRLRSTLHVNQLTAADTRIDHFTTRTSALSVLLTLSGTAFIGIGTFRYTPHPIAHNVFARGLPCLMLVLLVGLPWLAPQFSKAMYVISDLALAVVGAGGLYWLTGFTSLTNIEALAGLLFVGWFVVFSRQIAAIESDRLQAQLRYVQTHAHEVTPLSNEHQNDEQTLPGDSLPIDSLPVDSLQSRLASSR